MGAAEGETEGGFAMGGIGQSESDAPVAAANVFFADVLGGGGGISVSIFVVFADDGDVSRFDARRLNIIPIFAAVALADDEVDVVREFFGVIKIEAPLPVMVAVAKFAGGAVGSADLENGFTEAFGIPGEVAEGFLFGSGSVDVCE